MTCREPAGNVTWLPHHSAATSGGSRVPAPTHLPTAQSSDPPLSHSQSASRGSDAEPGHDHHLDSERRHLLNSRTALARMRVRTSRLDLDAAGDPVSQQYLASAIYRRMKALEDDPTVPLFFGRLDYSEHHEDARGERFYIGRRHVTDEVGDPMVVDWRAPISLAFYPASRTEPMGGERRRRVRVPKRGGDPRQGQGPPPGAPARGRGP